MPTVKLFVQLCCSGVTVPKTLEQIRPRHLEMERLQMMTGCKLTLSRKVRETAKVKNQPPEKKSHDQHDQHELLQTSTRARTVANLDIGRKTAGTPVRGAYAISSYRNTGRGESKHTGKGKGTHVDVVETEQSQPSETASMVSYTSQDPQCYWRALVHFKRGPADHGCHNPFRVIRKETTRCREFAS